MPDPIGATGATPLTGPQPGLDPSLTEPPDQFGQDTFLKLLVAQLKYQNPLDPMDGSEFMAQTAQFTTVEKLTELTDQLGESLANDRLGTATGMLGRQVTFTGDDGNPTSRLVTGVRLEPAGPVLLLDDGSQIGLGRIDQVGTAPS